MSNMIVIIPVHELDDTTSPFLAKAIDSVANQEKIKEKLPILIVYAAAIHDRMMAFKDSMTRKYENDIPIMYLPNNGNSDYQSQINFAVKNINNEYFSILEFDDEYSKTYFKNVNEYVKHYPKVDIFLTMMIETNDKDQALKFTNETVWAQQLVGENGDIGYLNSNLLKQYSDFKLSGAVIKTSEFNNLGQFKTNIKLSFMYEFLLRALNNDCKVFSIPKIGYKHVTTREGSMFDIYQKTMSMEERKFWFDTAVKESNFINDRIIDTSLIKK